MPVGRGRADAGPARRLGEGDTGRPLLGDQLEGGVEEGFPEVDVVVAAWPRAPAAAMPGPAHVKGLYMERGESSIARAPKGERLRGAALLIGPHGDAERLGDAPRAPAGHEGDLH